MTRSEIIQQYKYEDEAMRIEIQEPKNGNTYDVLIIIKYAEGVNLGDVFHNDTYEEAVARFYKEVGKQIKVIK